ncbi:dCTP deaminase [Candidatus Sumerlaeota bacterium]|nr:dCTP deaminase [Candidatus Sumerlaeota bacterium]
MILTGPEIRKQIDAKQIVIDPFQPELINPNSYNLRLHDELLIYDDESLDMRKLPASRRVKIPETGLVLTPGRLYLGRTLEYTETHGYVPMLEGRSSVGRLGLFVHVTAGFGDVGFKGYWTLEILCIHPIRIYAGVQICQIFYHTIDGDVLEYKSNKYQNNRDIQPSMLYKDFEKK